MKRKSKIIYDRTKKPLTIGDVQRMNKEAGQYWFEPAAKRFFQSRVPPRSTPLIKGKFFISSEQFVSSEGVRAPRKYSVRAFDRKTGSISTVGEFQQFKSSKEAKEFAKRLRI